MTTVDIAAKLGGLEGLKIASDLALVGAIEEGLPTSAVDAMVETGTLSAREMDELVIPRRKLAQRKQRKQRLTPEESDRLARIARITALAEETFGDEERAAHWLRAPNRGLGGAVPLEMLQTGEGAIVVQQALGQIAHGIFA